MEHTYPVIDGIIEDPASHPTRHHRSITDEAFFGFEFRGSPGPDPSVDTSVHIIKEAA